MQRLNRKAFGGLFFLLEPLEVREIMSRDVISVHPDYSVRDAAALMLTSRFGALPVIANDEVVGIVTQTDLLRCLVKMAAEPAGTKRRR